MNNEQVLETTIANIDELLTKVSKVATTTNAANLDPVIENSLPNSLDKDDIIAPSAEELAAYQTIGNRAREYRSKSKTTKLNNLDTSKQTEQYQKVSDCNQDITSSQYSPTMPTKNAAADQISANQSAVATYLNNIGQPVTKPKGELNNETAGLNNNKAIWQATEYPDNKLSLNGQLRASEFRKSTNSDKLNNGELWQDPQPSADEATNLPNLRRGTGMGERRQSFREASKGLFKTPNGKVSHGKVVIAVIMATLIVYWFLPGDNKPKGEKVPTRQGQPARKIKDNVGNKLDASGMPPWEVSVPTSSPESGSSLTSLTNADSANNKELGNNEELPPLQIPSEIKIGSRKITNNNNQVTAPPATGGNREQRSDAGRNNPLGNVQEGSVQGAPTDIGDIEINGVESGEVNNKPESRPTSNTDTTALTVISSTRTFSTKFRGAKPASQVAASTAVETKPAIKVISFPAKISLKLLEPIRSGLVSNVRALVLAEVRSSQGEIVVPINSTAMISFLANDVQGRLINDTRETVNFLLPNGEEIAAYGLLKGADGLLGIAGKERKLKGGGGALGAVGRSVKRVGSTIGAVAIGGVEGAIVKDTIDETGLNSTITSNNATVLEVKAGVICTLNVQTMGKR